MRRAVWAGRIWRRGEEELFVKAAPMTQKPAFRLMKLGDVQSVYHLQMPRWLFTDPRYTALSLEAKVAYTFLLNRFQLSRLNGWINDELTKAYADNGLIRVACTENSFRECGNVKRPINSMADLNGLKIRVPETKACQDFYTAIGAIPAAIATSETLAALEQGTVDGVDNSIYNMKSMGVLEKIKYITMLNYMYSGASITCSEEFWNSMTANQQAAFQQAADEAGAYFRENMRAETQTILDQGSFEVEEVDPSSDFYKQLKEKAVELWAGYASEYPSDIMDRINQDFSV